MSIFRSFFIQVVYCCMWCSALGVVAVVLRSRCVVLCTVCELDYVGLGMYREWEKIEFPKEYYI